MKRKRKQKSETSDKGAPLLPPVFDFSKRSHQAAFWMLLNTVIDSKPENSLRLAKPKI